MNISNIKRYHETELVLILLHLVNLDFPMRANVQCYCTSLNSSHQIHFIVFRLQDRAVGCFRHLLATQADRCCSDNEGQIHISWGAQMGLILSMAALPMQTKNKFPAQEPKPQPSSSAKPSKMHSVANTCLVHKFVPKLEWNLKSLFSTDAWYDDGVPSLWWSDMADIVFLPRNTSANPHFFIHINKVMSFGMFCDNTKQNLPRGTYFKTCLAVKLFSSFHKHRGLCFSNKFPSISRFTVNFGLEKKKRKKEKEVITAKVTWKITSGAVLEVLLLLWYTTS